PDGKLAPALDAASEKHRCNVSAGHEENQRSESHQHRQEHADPSLGFRRHAREGIEVDASLEIVRMVRRDLPRDALELAFRHLAGDAVAKASSDQKSLIT